MNLLKLLFLSAALLSAALLAAPASAHDILTRDEDGALKFTPLEDLMRTHNPSEDPDEPPVDPPVEGADFFDDFSDGLSIEDGQANRTGKRYVDSFAGWGVRRLANAPNLDVGEKRFIEGKTHILSADGLEMRAFRDNASPTKYYASMISTERSYAFIHGRVDIVMAMPEFTQPGLHFSLWLMPADGSAETEYDLGEWISSNRWAPNGPINSIFFNAKNNDGGHWKQYDVAAGFIKTFHTYSFIWKPDGLTWLIDDKVVHTAPNLYNRPMHFLATHEMGGSSNGDFPGPLNPNSTWPARVVIKSIRITEF